MKARFDYEVFHRQAFEEAIAEIPNGHGRRNTSLLPKAAYHAAKLGMDEEEYATRVADASAGCDPLRPDEIARAFKTAVEKVGADVSTGRFAFVSSHVQRGRPNYVPDLIERGGGTAHAAALRALSPVKVTGLADSPRAQTEAFLSLLWPPEDWLYLFDIEHPSPGVPGGSLRQVRDWMRVLQTGDIFMDGLVPNPFTGHPVTRTDGTASFITKDCLASFPYALVEFDRMPLGQQCALWTGFLAASSYRDRLAALTYSGGKSIHALIRINANDPFAQEHWRTVLTELFASNPVPALRADRAGFSPRQGTRLAGVKRACTGPVQELLYLRPMWLPPRSPRSV